MLRGAEPENLAMNRARFCSLGKTVGKVLGTAVISKIGDGQVFLNH